MEEKRNCESFSFGVVLLSNSVAVAIYAIGACVMSGFGIAAAVVYLLYCLWAEFSVLRRSCTDCYYYGKVCAFGKGKLCSLIFRQGDPREFAERKISWWDLLPDFMVLIFPLVGGIMLSVTNFSWLRVGALLALTALGSAGNAVIRGSFACKYCKQREIGCPAERLFGKARAESE